MQNILKKKMIYKDRVCTLTNTLSISLPCEEFGVVVVVEEVFVLFVSALILSLCKRFFSLLLDVCKRFIFVSCLKLKDKSQALKRIRYKNSHLKWELDF
jgi:hypothetical protein